MIGSHRMLICSFLGLLGALVVWQREAAGQAAEKSHCSGTVSDAMGKGIPGIVVQMVEPSGRVQFHQTDAKGTYRIPAPGSGTYVIVFREPQGKTHVHDVRQLTAGTDQRLSVTVHSATKSFQGAYGALQSVETLSAWVIAEGDDKVGPTMFESISPIELAGLVESIIKSLDEMKLNAIQRRFLLQKAETVRDLLRTVR
jgi:hypothetical protein